MTRIIFLAQLASMAAVANMIVLPDAAARDTPGVRFDKLVLTDKYYCDGIVSGDLNRDGKADIVAGPFWHAGPDFKTKHEFYPAKEFPTEPSPTDSMFSYLHDFNADGWLDILVLGRVHLHEAFWYENPQGQPGHWKKHFAFHRVQGESPPFLDVDGDGRPELVAHWLNRWGLIQPNWTEPTREWVFKPITDGGKFHHFYHGTGIGDVNGDGRLDLLLNEGWYEQPVEKAAMWTRHEFKFADKGGAQMFAYDVDGDGDNDIITALDAHGWGMAWFEHVREGGGITFQKHVIMGSRDEEAKYGATFSQPHALALGDMDGDGLKDIVTGKRRWAHGPTGDIEPMADPVVYWFQLVREQGHARYVPHLIDKASGVGCQVTVADVNGDGRPDILTVSKLGAFVFLNFRGLPAAPVHAQEIRATREGENLVRVVAPDRFEMTFSKRKGFGATWFDLKHDPGKKRDLAPVLDENGFFWIKIGKPDGDGSWYANPAEEMTLLEAGPARTRVRLRGDHMRYGYTELKAAWKELRFDQTWTLYPDGSAFVAYVLEHEEPVPYHHFLVITKSNGAWGPQGKGEGKGEVRIAGEMGAEKPKATSFTLQWSDGPSYFTDILMVAQKGRFGASYWNEGYLDKDIRSSFDIGGLWPEKTLPAGKQRLSFLMRFADDINSAGAAATHAGDYRSPDRLTVTRGETDKSEEGDRDVDGYNEDEGCYVLKAAADGVAFTIHGMATPRVNPVFKIKGWPGAAPAVVAVGDRTLVSGKGMAASVSEGALLMQIFATLREDTSVVVASGGK